MDRGLIFDIQRYCLHDGPGIRTTVFLKGCPLRCRWCHNPESQLREREIQILSSRCMRCGQCIEACPQGGSTADCRRSFDAGEFGRGTIAQPAKDCTLCARCIDACPTGARQLVGREMTVPEVIGEVLLDRTFHDQSGGGVTLSGGEPLAQAPFVLRLLRALRRESIHTALDTCGFAPRPTILEVAPWVDLFLFDIKSFDEETHRAHTGVSNSLILENLKTLASMHATIWVRVPLIPGFNLDDAQLSATACFMQSIPGIQQVSLLPYHRMGAHKSERTRSDDVDSSRRCYRVEDITQNQIDHAARLFRAAGLKTVIGGSIGND